MIHPSIFFECCSFRPGVAVVAKEDGMVEKGINGVNSEQKWLKR